MTFDITYKFVLEIGFRIIKSFLFQLFCIHNLTVLHTSRSSIESFRIHTIIISFYFVGFAIINLNQILIFVICAIDLTIHISKAKFWLFIPEMIFGFSIYVIYPLESSSNYAVFTTDKSSCFIIYYFFTIRKINYNLKFSLQISCICAIGILGCFITIIS